MKEVLSQIKSKTPISKDAVAIMLTNAHQCVKVHVALVHLTKTHEKVVRFILSSVASNVLGSLLLFLHNFALI